MSKNDYVIRLEKADEHREVETLVREAFWNVYRPGCVEHYVLHCLRGDADFVSELDFVMELNGRLIGQDVFVRTAIHADDGMDVPIMTMGPICIAPDLQGKGYGKILLDYALEKAAAGCATSHPTSAWRRWSTFATCAGSMTSSMPTRPRPTGRARILCWARAKRR